MSKLLVSKEVPSLTRHDFTDSFRTDLHQNWKSRMGIVFVLPAVILLVVFLGYPLVRSLYLSLFNWNGIGEPAYIGIQNFQRMLSGTEFLVAIWNTLLYTFISAFGTVVLGFLLAVAIEQRVRGWGIFKVVFFLPVIVSQTITGLIWVRLLDPLMGPINPFLRELGINAPNWLSDQNWVLIVIGLVAVWQYTGFPMLILLTAMENIPTDIHDAATLDGVSQLQRMSQIIGPMILPNIAVILMLQIIFSLKVFDIIWVMTQGGPGIASASLGIMLYRLGFQTREFGYASAWAVAMAVIIMTISLLYQRYFRPEAIEY